MTRKEILDRAAGAGPGSRRNEIYRCEACGHLDSADRIFKLDHCPGCGADIVGFEKRS